MGWWCTIARSWERLVLGCTLCRRSRPVDLVSHHDLDSSKSEPPSRASTHLVNPHSGHIQHLGNGVHDADTGPSLVLPLTQIEDRHDGCLFVLRWVTGDDFVTSFQVFGIEFEWNLRVWSVRFLNVDGPGRTDGLL